MTILDLGFGCRLHLRDEWAQGRPPVGGTPRQPSDITQFWAHHSGGNVLGDPDPMTWVRNIYDEHVHGRGYSDIAYELLADERGDLWEGRALTIVSAATLNNNTHGAACCLLRAHDPEGDAHVPDQIKTAFRLAYALIAARAGHPLGQGCHRDVFATDCPGDDLCAWVHSATLAIPPGPPPIPVSTDKVPPMYRPPVPLPPIVASMDVPGGGAWLGVDNGIVYAFHHGAWVTGGLVSPAGRAAFTGRHLADLVPPDPKNHPHDAPDAPYIIVATSGERYDPRT